MIQVWGVGGALKLVVLIAVTAAMPLSGASASFDWSPLFIALAFFAVPVLCVVHLVLTPFAAAHFHSRRRIVEAASMVVPLGYLVAGCYVLGVRLPNVSQALRQDARTTEERCAAGEGVWDAYSRTCMDDRDRPRALLQYVP